MDKNVIFHLRAKQHLSQQALAEKIFVSRQTISAWEKGKSQPSLETKILIAELFHIEKEKLMSQQDIKEQKSRQLKVKSIKDAFLSIVASGENKNIRLESVAFACNLRTDEVRELYPHTQSIFFELVLETYNAIENKISAISSSEPSPLDAFCRDVLPEIHRHYTLLHILYSREYSDKSWSRSTRKRNHQLCENFLKKHHIQHLIHDRSFHVELLVSLITSFIEVWMRRSVPLSLEQAQKAFRLYTTHSTSELIETA
ncbi:helix-turn-helix transcriptional regulator [Fructobacillus sp. M1-13]|uniref:Helix-turn-helix transcriptional regulator n=1 Tax=Fructobacillus papyriferae TaxID=2713171 RepID=A0ABS5QQ54_9LACO|nr:helix-turn-helix transcriptional regulator [Fructobacillus papyriferae]MBS9334469.1 helix-turn-helix transcriptional regulator [Fructobacillus papyriferae]MCD2158458.1 helix-turn-helix transcriptional regulator [Fructobacillus papyriferae]